MRCQPGLNSSAQIPQAPVVVWYFGSVSKQSQMYALPTSMRPTPPLARCS